MTNNQFIEFISDNELYTFDALLEVILKENKTFQGVWIQAVPPLNKSNDMMFKGKAEGELFYIINNDEYKVLQLSDIVEIKLVAKHYLIK